MNRLVLLVSVLGLIGCGSPPENPLASPKEEVVVPADPVIEKLSYYSKNTYQTLEAPLAADITLGADFESPVCPPTQAEIIIEGQFDATSTESFELVGAQSYIVNLVGSKFTLQACLASGVSALSLSTVSSAAVKNTKPALLSITTNGNVQTIGRGLANYPNPGIKTAQVVSQYSLGTQNGITLDDISVGDVATQTVVSTGNTSLTLETGHVNFVRQ
ncbi:MAG: hypothetical protein ACK5V3_08555 [Bdellovibrionales bacterium]